MSTQMEVAKHRLFDEAGLGVSNIKLFPGDNRSATAEEIAAEINRSITRIETGDYDLVADDAD